MGNCCNSTYSSCFFNNPENINFMEKNTMYWLLAYVTIFLAITSNEALEQIKDDRESIFQDDLTIESVETRRKIVSYNKALMSEEEINDEKTRLEEECNCVIDHLRSAGAFILTFKSSEEKNAMELKLDSSKEAASDDQVMEIFNEGAVDDQVMGIFNEL